MSDETWKFWNANESNNNKAGGYKMMQDRRNQFIIVYNLLKICDSPWNNDGPKKLNLCEEQATPQ